MDAFLLFARVTIFLFLLFLKNAYTVTLRTYHMEDNCGEEISMILGSIYSGKLTFYSDRMLNCTVTIETWYSEPYIQFYFEDFDLGSDDCLTGTLKMKDGESVYAPKITDLGSSLCGSQKPAGVYRTYTRYLRIEYASRRYAPLRPAHFSIIFNSFDVGICESWEYRCDNFNCIRDEINCNGYNPCGDHSDCKLSVGAIVGIVVGSCAGLTGLVAVIVALIYCHRQRKFGNAPSQGLMPNVPYAISTPGTQPGVTPFSNNPWYSNGQQQMVYGTTYGNSPVPPTTQEHIPSQPVK